MEWVATTLTPPPNVVYPALLKLMRTPRLPAVDWTDAPTDLNVLVHFGERRNLISARVPSRSARAIQILIYNLWALRTAHFSEFLLDSSISFTSGIAVVLMWLNTDECLWNMSHIRMRLNYPFAAWFIYIIFQNLVPTAHTHTSCLHYNDNQSILFWDIFSVNFVNYKTRIYTSRGGVKHFWMLQWW